MVMGELDICARTATLTTKEEIVGVVVQYIEVCLKRSITSPCAMLEKLLTELGELGLSLGTALLPPIIHVIMVDHLVFIVMVIK